MKALHLFETPVAVHRSARTAIPEGLNLPDRRSENLKCRSLLAAVRFISVLKFSYFIQANAGNKSSLFCSQ
jgi:hypothetical protein